METPANTNSDATPAPSDGNNAENTADTAENTSTSENTDNSSAAENGKNAENPPVGLITAGIIAGITILALLGIVIYKKKKPVQKA